MTSELAKFIFTALSGAFGGLLAYGFNAIGPKSSVVDAGWR